MPATDIHLGIMTEGAFSPFDIPITFKDGPKGGSVQSYGKKYSEPISIKSHITIKAKLDDEWEEKQNQEGGVCKLNIKSKKTKKQKLKISAILKEEED